MSVPRGGNGNSISSSYLSLHVDCTSAHIENCGSSLSGVSTHTSTNSSFCEASQERGTPASSCFFTELRSPGLFNRLYEVPLSHREIMETRRSLSDGVSREVGISLS